MTTIILCGGAGTRLWPASRPERPKQFARLLEGPTLYQRTILRNLAISDRFLVVTNRMHLELAAEQFEESAGAGRPVSFLLEPMGRNTAPAVALAALETAEALGPTEPLLIVPADHEVRDEAAYRGAVARAGRAAAEGMLATFGIAPDFPETGYGYIEAGEALGGSLAGGGILGVKAFREKPPLEKAKEYLAEGNFYWNSGMFVFGAGTAIEEFGHYAGATLEASRHALAGAERRQFKGHAVVAIRDDGMAAIPANSIDYAIMEKSRRVAVIPVSMGWNDLGSFDALYDASDRDEAGNALQKGTIAQDTSGCLVLAPGLKVRLSGVSDLIVVQDGDRLVIVKKGRSQSVKELAAADAKSGAQT